MTPRPPIFISAVSKELKSARQLVANTLQFLGYEPVWQDIFGTEQGDLRAILRKKIGACEGVVQLVGSCYGVELPTPDEQFGRVSYTQYEARYARQLGKKVWYLVLDESFPSDPHDAEAEGFCGLQAAYRKGVQSDTHVFHALNSRESLETQVLKISKVFEETRERYERRWRRIKWVIAGALSLLVMVLGLVAWLVIGEFRRAQDRWVGDRFVGVCVAQTTAGTLLGEEAYEIPLQIKNRTSMPLIITEITVVSRNEDAARLLGMNNPQVFKGEIHIPYYLGGHESTNVPVRLNQILPKEITVRIYHNQSDPPSEFKINLGGKILPMPAPRYLGRKQVFAGYDGQMALQQAGREAHRWSPDAQIMASFPGNSRVLLDEESRLKYTVVESWITSFYSPARRRMFVAIISAHEVKGAELDETPDSEKIPKAASAEPVLGYQQALDLANRASLLSADWQSLRLVVVNVEGKPVCAWHLPYRAASGLPVIIDATTGDQLLASGEKEFRRARLQPAPLAP